MSRNRATSAVPTIVRPVTDAPFEIETMQPTIGAEIRGLDLTQKMSAETFQAFEAAIIAHKVIYLRDQNLTTAQHVAIGRMFGDLEVHPFRPEGEFPEIIVMDNHKDNPVLSTDVWHSDATFRQCPTKYSILRCLQIPKLGGDTLWCDMFAAYEGLSETMRGFIDDLWAVHDFKNFRALYGKSDEDQKKLRRMEELYPNPNHPVVRTHPVSRRKALFVSQQFTLGIVDMNRDESEAMLHHLYQQVQVPEYQFRLRWKPDTIVFWDNRSTQHYAANDYYPNRRHMERVAVIGDKPF